jgi:murein L,D-transpeptidase YcbB/YkuD
MNSISSVRLLGALLAAGVAALPAGAQEAAPEAGAVVPPILEPALAPEAEALKAALAAETAALPDERRLAIDGFFAARDYAPFWTEAGSDRADALVAALGASGAQGLPRDRYRPEELALLLDPAGTASPAEREVAATAAYLDFAGDLSAGILVPGKVDADISRRPKRPAAAVLLAPLGHQSVPAALASFEPADPDYRQLVAEKARLEALAETAAWGPAVADGPTLHPGERGPRIAELRGRLARLGYVVPDGEAAGDAFDDRLEASVERFQRDYGLVADGVVGERTLAALNAPVESRLAQVVVNLERMRWMPADLGERHLFVNIPDFTVRLVEDGRTTWESKVVVGKTRVTETQEFSDEVTYLVVNPTWHIPNSIAIRDYLPKLQKDPMVLKRQNIDLMTRGGTIINPKLVDFTQYTPENFPFRIKQRPNDDNALGKVKFMFPNEHSIYLHDTPHKEYFAREVRAYSNGCIRVEKPVELAEILLAPQEADPAAAFQGWVDAKSERQVTLERRVPVHIGYRTVWFDDAGAVHYRADVYGRDAEILRALEDAGVALGAAQG